MNLSAELEKLVSLRDRGDLSPEEFEKAKALLLSDSPSAPPALPSSPDPGVPGPDEVAAKAKKQATQQLTAICLSVAAGLSGGSLAIAPGPLNGVIFALWLVAATLGWASYMKTKSER